MKKVFVFLMLLTTTSLSAQNAHPSILFVGNDSERRHEIFRLSEIDSISHWHLDNYVNSVGIYSQYMPLRGFRVNNIHSVRLLPDQVDTHQLTVQDYVHVGLSMDSLRKYLPYSNNESTHYQSLLPRNAAFEKMAQNGQMDYLCKYPYISFTRNQIDTMHVNYDEWKTSVLQNLFTNGANDTGDLGEKLDFVNGEGFVSDSVRLLRPIKIEAESSYLVIRDDNDTYTYVRQLTDDKRNHNVPGEISNNKYVEIGHNMNYPPVFDIMLPNVLAGEYAIYAVMVPSNILNETDDDEVMPNSLMAQVSYHDKEGRLNGTTMISNGKITRSLDFLQDENGRRMNVNSSLFVSNKEKVDTMLLGYQTFGPVAYPVANTYGYDYESLPYLHIMTRSSARIRQDEQVVRVACDPVIRLDCVLLVPRELDDYAREHPEFKFKFD